MREPTAALLCKEIENLGHRLAGFREPLASEFRAAAGHWLDRAQAQHDQARARLERAPAPQVFRAGDPVDREREAFVPRERVLGQIDRQLTLATGCPGLILYGRRRMGKSTLLRNLTDILPTSARVARVSLMQPEAVRSQPALLGLIAATLRTAMGDLAPPPDGPIETPAVFAALLDDCNARLDAVDGRLLIALDEYEYLDWKLGEGVFQPDLLPMIRESIQSHRRLTWVFAGSHGLDELTHADWSSWLVSARTIEVPGFSLEETRRLLTEPLRHSALWAKDDPKRPRFAPGFWGEGGIERIQAESGGWPHLVQLLAETTVDLLNADETRAGVDGRLLEEAIAQSVTLGDTVLRQLMHPEEASPAEWAWLEGFRTRDTQPPPPDEATRRALRRRLLVVEDGDAWRLRVPLMQRWLRERG